MATTTLLTAEEFLAFPESLYKPELVQGEVVEMAPVGGYHSNTQLALGMYPRLHTQRRAQGRVGVELGFILTTDPDTVRAPDVSFISAEQLRTTPLSAGFYPGYPDTAAEVVSPGDAVTQLDAKVQDYLDAGTRLVWVVNPDTRSVAVYSPDGQIRILGADDVLTGGAVLPALEIPVSDLFLGQDG
ncbi:MAG: Uma2 family endonuclease [Chloroflexota bacterium]|nr:Uma2 family endonuclease [Chloroflexota bacterium]